MKSPLTTLLILLSLTCFSQSGEDYKKVITSRTLNVSPQSGFIASNSSVTLQANNNGTKALANIVYSIAKAAVNLDLKVEQQVSSTGKVQPITLDGLADKTSVVFGFQWLPGKTENLKAYQRSYAQTQFTTVLALDGSQLVSKENKRHLQLLGLTIPCKFYLGGKFGLTQQEFSFLADTTTSFLQSEASKTAVKISLTIGGLWTFGTLAATFTHIDNFEGGDSHTFNFPVNGTGVQIEKEFLVGAPLHKTDQRLRFEYMSIGNSGMGKVFRVNPSINISFKKKKGTLELPIFFLPNKEDKEVKLNGGVFANYLTDEDFKFKFKKKNWGLGVFIGGSISDLF